MITLLVLVAPHVFPAAELESARHRLEARTAVQGRPGGSDEAEPEALGLAVRLRSKARWAERLATPSQTPPCCAGSCWSATSSPMSSP